MRSGVSCRCRRCDRADCAAPRVSSACCMHERRNAWRWHACPAVAHTWSRCHTPGAARGASGASPPAARHDPPTPSPHATHLFRERVAVARHNVVVRGAPLSAHDLDDARNLRARGLAHAHVHCRPKGQRPRRQAARRRRGAPRRPTRRVREDAAAADAAAERVLHSVHLWGVDAGVSRRARPPHQSRQLATQVACSTRSAPRHPSERSRDLPSRACCCAARGRTRSGSRALAEGGGCSWRLSGYRSPPQSRVPYALSVSGSSKAPRVSLRAASTQGGDSLLARVCAPAGVVRRALTQQ